MARSPATTPYEKYKEIVRRSKTGNRDAGKLAQALYGTTGRFVRPKKDGPDVALKEKTIRSYIQECKVFGLLREIDTTGRLEPTEIVRTATTSAEMAMAVTSTVSDYLTSMGVPREVLTNAVETAIVPSPKAIYDNLPTDSRIPIGQLRRCLQVLTQADDVDAKSILVSTQGKVYVTRSQAVLLGLVEK